MICMPLRWSRLFRIGRAPGRRLGSSFNEAGRGAMSDARAPARCDNSIAFNLPHVNHARAHPILLTQLFVFLSTNFRHCVE